MYLLYLMCICRALYVFVVPHVYFLGYVCIVFLTLDAGLLARSQYPEGPATATSTQVFLGFLVSTCLSCSPPDLNSLVTFLSVFVYM